MWWCWSFLFFVAFCQKQQSSVQLILIYYISFVHYVMKPFSFYQHKYYMLQQYLQYYHMMLLIIKSSTLFKNTFFWLSKIFLLAAFPICLSNYVSNVLIYIEVAVCLPGGGYCKIDVVVVVVIFVRSEVARGGFVVGITIQMMILKMLIL